MNICVIPARGGSKRIPRKNIREFCGKPMIAWSIEAAQQTGCFQQILVSTDDPEIAEVARCSGADVPYLRPEVLSDDHAGTTSVVVHAIEWLQAERVVPEAVCCLYATAPFVQAADLIKGLALLDDVGFDRFVLTASRYGSPIQRALRINPEDGLARMWQPEHFSERSQDLEEGFHDAGQFYWGRPQAWLSASNLFDGSKLLLLPRWRVQDIDTEDDWHRAELMYQALAADLNHV